MRHRLKFVLPAINLIVAVPLIVLGELRLNSSSMGSTPKELSACYAITAPATICRYRATAAMDKVVAMVCSQATMSTCYRIESSVDPVIFLLGVVLVWYCVGLEIE
jgi:hypothetical protein